MHIDDHWISHPQGRLFARRWTPAAAGDAAPIVLLHESLGCVSLWRDFPAALSGATGRRVVAYDRLGYGNSDARADVLPALDFMADEARLFFPALCAQLDIPRFVAFGHSTGGSMALHCAAQWPAACEAVITESAQVFVEDVTLAGVRDAQRRFADPAQVERLARHHGDKAAWVLQAWLGTWLNPAFGGWSMAGDLPRVSSPALAIHGIDDEYGSPDHARRIAATVAGPAQLALLAGTRHVPHVERVDEVLRVVAAFLKAPPTVSSDGPSARTPRRSS